MIHRDRNETPPALTALHEDWIDRLAGTPELNPLDEWDRVRRLVAIRETRNSLIRMYERKCCFCELVIPGQTVEHFVPKSASPDKLLDYTNLHLICSDCNSKKGNRTVEDVIDPSAENPSEHVIFKTQKIEAVTDKGRSTIKKIGLDSAGLDDLRQNVLDHVIRRIEVITTHAEVDGIGRETLELLLSEVIVLREENLQPSSIFSKMIVDNAGNITDDLELKLNNKIEEIN